ncbi:3-oxoacyl-(acyl-carrier-protein) synthase-3 [Frankia sp. EI5c]|uniref:ketoacyl-ACP synthase III family protein n=1 Tax=Frankia sp. EI5c TaxID=683316 RepID=UPI0007C382E6|nr:ketoacyl-ACP synthase III family protein [Frankia sp. EI5c]OAA29509.1 3-oxoacyl-(acyl-carrier-protein) synthase-3 [Frankia sp. EI5c]
MRTDTLVVNAAAAWLPPRRQVPAEIGATAEDTGYTALAVSDGPSAPEMAVLAADAALEQAGWPAAELDLLLHAWSYYQGHDFWSPAHYIADQLGAHAAQPIGIQQMCNGGAAGLQIAAAHLLGDPSIARVLVTTADRFCPPGFDRWNSDLGVAYGDGASAVLVSRDTAGGAGGAGGAGAGEAGLDAPAAGPVVGAGADERTAGANERAGALRLVAVSSVSAPNLEGMHRGDDDFSPAARATAAAVDVRRTKRAYLRRHGSSGYRAAERERVETLLRLAVDEAGLTRDGRRPRYVVLPRVHRGPLESVLVPLVGEVTGAEPLDFGRSTGHLGAGDLTTGISDLLDNKILAPGETALVLSTGAGFTWSCAALTAPAG